MGSGLQTSTLLLPPGEAMAARLKGVFVDRAYAPVDPPMLLPADVVLDRLGEDIRRRLLLVTAPDGSEMCLRPDFTLPVARAHLDAGAGAAGRYTYAGLAFRFPAGGERTRISAEFHQAGIEYFGDDDAEAADAEVLAASVAALAEMGLADIELTLGDVALFDAFVEALALGPGWKKRLIGDFRAHEFARDMMRTLAVSGGGNDAAKPDAAFAQALAGMEVTAARAVVEDVMAIAGTAPVGGRTVAEIAERFVEQAQFSRDGAMGEEIFSALDRFLGLNTPPPQAVGELRQLARSAAGLTPAVDAFERRLDRLEAAGVDLSRATFRADFAGRIEYYTGMVFEIRSPANPDLGPIASGGRYDGFLAEMGADGPVPAVGASVYVDRLVAALEAGS
ncbi:ATP phosphoribosyltransferase regulatory subunit [hydrothermal vent metagenome]|uniref:ATP phosphoribosyltransferase regulatory subunit n=1 Tax=hydrothermal vent metagenome TaxID=652676 RepID=A0A3B0SYP4_9ZZZZ